MFNFIKSSIYNLVKVEKFWFDENLFLDDVVDVKMKYGKIE